DGTTVNTQIQRLNMNNKWNMLITQSSPGHGWTQTQLDGAARPVIEKVAGAQVQSCSVTSSNCTTTPTYDTSYLYDLHGRLVRQSRVYLEGDTLTDGISYTYDASDRKTSETSPLE